MTRSFDLEVPHKLLHLLVVLALLPLAGGDLEPVIVVAEHGEEHVALRADEVHQLHGVVDLLELGWAEGHLVGEGEGEDPGGDPSLLVLGDPAGEEGEGVGLLGGVPAVPPQHLQGGRGDGATVSM